MYAGFGAVGKRNNKLDIGRRKSNPIGLKMSDWVTINLLPVLYCKYTLVKSNLVYTNERKKIMSKKEKKGLNGRDLINIGIYSAIYFVIVMAFAMTGLIPIMLILLSSMIAIVGGIPFMLFLTKVKKSGMILIMSLIMGILMFVTGMTWMPIPFAAVTGILSELAYRGGGYKSIKSAVLTCGIFPLWAVGNYLPLFLQREQYFADRTSYGQEYIDSVMNFTSNWMFFVLVIMTFVCGIIGGLIGKVLLKKHFKKAGIA